MLKSSEKDRMTEKRKTISRLFARVHSMFICGQRGSYDLVKKQNGCNATSGASSRKTFLPPKDEKFLMTLYKEGLLNSNIIIKDGSKKYSLDTLVVFVKYEHPAINICMGFTNAELLLTNRFEKYRRYMPNNVQEIDGTCRIQIGINRVLYGKNKADNGARFDGFPAAMWFDVYDPVFEQLLLLKIRARRRRRRSIFTRKNKHRLLQPPRSRPIYMGDVIPNGLDLYGPRLGIMDVRDMRNDHFPIAVLNHRLAEQGERERLRRNFNATNSIDPLQNLNISDRGLSQHYPRRMSVPRNVRRSGSNPDQPDNIERERIIPWDFDEADAFNAPLRPRLQHAFVRNVPFRPRLQLNEL